MKSKIRETVEYNVLCSEINDERIINCIKLYPMIIRYIVNCVQIFFHKYWCQNSNQKVCDQCNPNLTKPPILSI